MAILKKTNITGSCDCVLINQDSTDLETTAINEADVGFEGFAGDIHSSLTRSSCVRVKTQYPQGTEIRNVRQLSIVSSEELDTIAQKMQVSNVDPAWVGANLLLSGISDLTLLPPGSRLIFSGGVSLVVDMENEPCKYPGEIIDRHFPGRGKYFVKAAIGRRGITAWVERGGCLKTGESVSVHMPPQRLYPAEFSFVG
ncbi:MAG: MOSC domain-containing protein [Granulosicoccus sp.]|nr:MOSC domain-containing protein [Granulosicoccus sp.]